MTTPDPVEATDLIARLRRLGGHELDDGTIVVVNGNYIEAATALATLTAELAKAEGRVETVMKRVPYPGTEGAPAESPHDMSHMIQIEALIADMQSIRERFGNTCVYVRRGGLSWGAVALNRRADDEKFGLFDLQEQHDRDTLERLKQIERLCAERDALKAQLVIAENEAKRPDNIVGRGHGASCYYCGEPVNNLHGNPWLWSVALCHADDPGRVKWHHTGCVTKRLVENQASFKTLLAEVRDKALQQCAEIIDAVSADDPPPEYAELAERATDAFNDGYSGPLAPRLKARGTVISDFIRSLKGRPNA